MILSRFITIWNDKEFDMDKRDYELLLALDQHKNITKAAQSLYMTQPAITKRIQKMEEELHCPLLIRSKRGVLLTPAAESLLPCARTILKNMEQMEELAGGILPKIFIKRYMTQTTQKIYRTISCCPRNIKKILRGKKQKGRRKHGDLVTGQLKN